jgi:hypothetical protein
VRWPPSDRDGSIRAMEEMLAEVFPLPREGVRVAHADDAGRRYAEDALVQLARIGAWRLERARPGGLDDSVSRLEKTLASDRS